MSTESAQIGLEEFQQLIDEALPLCRLFGIRTESIGYGEATMKMHFNPDLIRPGGTVAGPALMAIADATLYAVVLGMIGRVELAVTTSLNINFLRKPSADARIIAKCTLLKVGRTLIVGEVSLYSEGFGDLVAHVVGTYSVPPNHD